MKNDNFKKNTRLESLGIVYIAVYLDLCETLSHPGFKRFICHTNILKFMCLTANVVNF